MLDIFVIPMSCPVKKQVQPCTPCIALSRGYYYLSMDMAVAAAVSGRSVFKRQQENRTGEKRMPHQITKEGV